MSRLMEQDQHLLRQENERLQAEVGNIKEDLMQSREKVIKFKKKPTAVILVFHFLSLAEL